MPNQPTTPASVASRLTDEWIDNTANNFDNEGYNYIAAVLREYVLMRKENAKVKARLEAVVKECENQIPNCRLEDGKCDPSFSDYCGVECHTEVKVHEAVTAILRAARGESETENK